MRIVVFVEIVEGGDATEKSGARGKDGAENSLNKMSLKEGGGSQDSNDGCQLRAAFNL